MQDTGRQDKQQGEATNPQNEGKEGINKLREDYTNLKKIYSYKAIVQIMFAAGVIYSAYSDFNLLPPSAVIYLTGTYFDLLVATSMNRGPKNKWVLRIFRFFKWVNVITEACLLFILLYKVDISGMQAVYWIIGVVMVCLGIISSVVEIVLNRPNDD